jgi:hypothetical protein
MERLALEFQVTMQLSVPSSPVVTWCTKFWNPNQRYLFVTGLEVGKLYEHVESLTALSPAALHMPLASCGL